MILELMRVMFLLFKHALESRQSSPSLKVEFQVSKLLSRAAFFFFYLEVQSSLMMTNNRECVTVTVAVT